MTPFHRLELGDNKRIACFQDESVFYQIKDDWNRLAEQTHAYSVFMRHEWFEAAWQWLKNDCRMYLFIVYKDDIPIAIGPFANKITRKRHLKIRVIQFLAIPDTQCCDILAAEEHRADAANAIVDLLYQLRGDWDHLDLRSLPCDSPTVNHLTSALESHSLAHSLASDGDNPGVSLNDDWNAYYSRRSRRLKKGNNWIANRIKRAGKSIELKWINWDSAGQQPAQSALEDAVAISAKSWKEQTALSLDNPGPNSFIRTLTEHAQKNGWLSLWIFYLDAVPVAMEYQIAYKGRIHALRSDYDPDFQDLSPGTYMNWKILEALFSSGLQCYQMGPGNNPYKYRWAETFDALQRITAYSTTWRGNTLGFYEHRLLPIARKIMRRNSTAGVSQ